MEIKTRLPFDCCENCEDYLMHVEEQVIFVQNGSVREILVSCKRENQCRRMQQDRISNEIKRTADGGI